MLNKQSIVMAGHLMADTVGVGKVAYAKQGSLLGNLITQLSVVHVDKIPQIEHDAAIYRASVPLQTGDVDIHNIEKNHIANHLSDVMDNIANNIRNIINPTVRDILADITETVATMVDSGNSSVVNIVPMHLSPIFNEDYLDMMLRLADSTVKSMPAAPTELTHKLKKNLGPKDFLIMMKGSSENFNKALDELVETYYPNGSYMSIDFGDISNISISDMDMFTKNNDLISYLFLRGVYEGKHPEISFGDLDSNEQAYVKRLTSYWAGRVALRIERIAKRTTNGTVVIATDVDLKTIYVNRVAYTRWIKAGGSSDALIGYWMSKGYTGNMSNLDQAVTRKSHMEDLNARYTRNAHNQLNIKAASVTENRVYTLVRRAIKDLIVSEDERTIAQNILVGHYKDSKLNSFLSTDRYVRFMVCKTIGRHSDALSILNDIDDYVLEFPEATDDEARVNAFTKHVADWIAGQIVLLDSDGKNDSSKVLDSGVF